jgi:hypothetical protein
MYASFYVFARASLRLENNTPKFAQVETKKPYIEVSTIANASSVIYLGNPRGHNICPIITSKIPCSSCQDMQNFSRARNGRTLG